MTAFDYIKNYVNIKLETSKIHGVGVFALRDINTNEELFKLWENESGEYTLTENDLDSLDDSVKTHLLDMYGYKIINGKYQMFVILNKDCHWIFKTPYHWVNSCGFDGEPNVDRNTLRATFNIKKGEEILFKYGKYEKFKKNNLI